MELSRFIRDVGDSRLGYIFRRFIESLQFSPVMARAGAEDFDGQRRHFELSEKVVAELLTSPVESRSVLCRQGIRDFADGTRQRDGLRHRDSRHAVTGQIDGFLFGTQAVVVGESHRGIGGRGGR